MINLQDGMRFNLQVKEDGTFFFSILVARNI
jgi:hypothetical protein